MDLAADFVEATVASKWTWVSGDSLGKGRLGLAVAV
jgi:hypothetical protein